MLEPRNPGGTGPRSAVGPDATIERLAASGSASPFVIALLGQSSLKYLNAPTTPYNAAGVPRPRITANGGQGNVTWVGAPPGTPSRILELAVTDAAVQAPQVISGATIQINPGIAVLAAWLGHMWPATPFVIKDLAEGESSRLDLASDAEDAVGDSPRTWADTAAIVGYKASEWGPVDLVLEVWTMNDQAALDAFGTEFAPFYLTERLNGRPFSLGTANPDSTLFRGAAWNHSLWDNAAPSLSDKGRGLLARTTRWAFIPEMLTRARDAAMRAFAADPRVAGVFGQEPVGFFGNYQDGGHARVDDKDGDGQGLAIRALFPAIARARGVAVRQPQDYRLVVAPDRLSAQIVVKLPNGGNLTTERIAQGRAFPSSPLAYQQPATGVLIRRAGWTEAQMQPVYRIGTAGTSPGRRQVEGTVTILDPGRGTGAGREGRLLYVPHPDFPLRDGDQIYLNWDLNNLSPPAIQMSGFFSSPQKPYLDCLVESVPSLTDPGQPPAFRFGGIGLRAWQPGMTV